MRQKLCALLLTIGASVLLTGSALAQAPREERLEIAVADQDIAAEQFQRALIVEGGDESRQTRPRVGVALEASGLRVHLHNVHGEVRFRGSLGPLLQRVLGTTAPGQMPVTEPAGP